MSIRTQSHAYTHDTYSVRGPPGAVGPKPGVEGTDDEGVDALLGVVIGIGVVTDDTGAVPPRALVKTFG